MTDYCLVLCTFANSDVAQHAAKQAVDKQLAACVNILPGVQSIYRWQDQIEVDTEVQVIFKSKHELTEQLYDLVCTIHTYTTPEWLILPVTGGSTDYLQWMKSNLK